MPGHGIITRRHAPSGAWLALLAIALHAFAPLLVASFNRAATTHAAQAHDHAAHGHHHGTPDTAARDTPAPPELVCVGDCPCCSLGERSLFVPLRAALLLPAARIRSAPQPVTPIRSHVFYPGAHFPPRAPPLSA
jgi:hypothetical protein